MKLTDNKAKKILDFLTKRIGYNSWKLEEHWALPGLFSLIFCIDNDYVNNSELLISKTKGNLNTWLFYDDITYVKLVKQLIKNKELAMCSRNLSSLPKCRELMNCSYPWINIFKKTDTLESLLIEADLDI